MCQQTVAACSFDVRADIVGTRMQTRRPKEPPNDRDRDWERQRARERRLARLRSPPLSSALLRSPPLCFSLSGACVARSLLGSTTQDRRRGNEWTAKETGASRCVFLLEFVAALLLCTDADRSKERDREKAAHLQVSSGFQWFRVRNLAGDED